MLEKLKEKWLLPLWTVLRVWYMLPWLRNYFRNVFNRMDHATQ